MVRFWFSLGVVCFDVAPPKKCRLKMGNMMEDDFRKHTMHISMHINAIQCNSMHHTSSIFIIWVWSPWCPSGCSLELFPTASESTQLIQPWFVESILSSRRLRCEGANVCLSKSGTCCSFHFFPVASHSQNQPWSLPIFRLWRPRPPGPTSDDRLVASQCLRT